MDAPIRQAPIHSPRAPSAPSSSSRAAVFLCALDDARGPRLPSVKRAAVAFLLADTGMFEFWAAVLVFSAATMRQHVRQALTAQPDPSRGVVAA